MNLLAMLPTVVLGMLFGYILFYKSRNIGVPVVIMLAFMSSVGYEIAGWFGIVGVIMAGAFVLGMTALFMRKFS